MFERAHWIESREKSGGIPANLQHCVAETIAIETRPLSMVNGNGQQALRRLRPVV
jgi:hypothetical protein